MNRRTFLRNGLWILAAPSLILPRKSIAQSLIYGTKRSGFSAGTTPAAGGGNGLLNGLLSVWEMEDASGVSQSDPVGGHVAANGSSIRSSTHIQGSFSVAAGGNVFTPQTSSGFRTLGSFSYYQWFNGNGGAQNGYVQRNNVGNVYQSDLFPGNSPRWLLWDASSGTHQVNSTKTVNDTNWHMIVLVYDSAATIGKISVDNETFVVTSALSGGIFGPDNSVIQFGGGSYLVDENAYWDAVVLTQTQVNTLWNGGAGFFYNNNGGNWTT